MVNTWGERGHLAFSVKVGDLILPLRMMLMIGVDTLSYWSSSFLSQLCWQFYHEGDDICHMRFLHLLRMIIFFLFVNVANTLIGILKVKPILYPGINPILSWFIILFIHWCVWFINIFKDFCIFRIWRDLKFLFHEKLSVCDFVTFVRFFEIMIMLTTWNV